MILGASTGDAYLLLISLIYVLQIMRSGGLTSHFEILPRANFQNI